MFPDVQELFSQFYTYAPMTDEEFQISNIDDTIEWADAISNEWNGDESGIQEERAQYACEIIQKLNEVKDLVAEMGNL